MVRSFPEINESGDRNGCSTCDATKSGWSDGHWTVDHQPPYRLVPDGPRTGYPQCAACMAQQGGIVRAILGGNYDFLLSYRREIHEAWFFRGVLFLRAASD